VENMSREFLMSELKDDAQRAYDAREEALGEEVMRELERRVMLSVLDRKWREHLYEMDYLREGIGLRAYSQRDPLVEYQREGFELFGAMMDSIKEESVGYLFNVEVQVTTDDDALDDEAAALSGEPSQWGTADISAAPTARDGSAPGLEAVSDDEEAALATVASEHHPSIVAKGLEAPSHPKNLSYSAPTVDGDGGTEVHADPDVDEFAGVSRNEPCPCGSGRKFKRCHGDPARRNA
jgi:preprotein translocase subunit SecA